jgi:hypothetical protein
MMPKTSTPTRSKKSLFGIGFHERKSQEVFKLRVEALDDSLDGRPHPIEWTGGLPQTKTLERKRGTTEAPQADELNAVQESCCTWLLETARKLPFEHGFLGKERIRPRQSLNISWRRWLSNA